MTATYRLTFHTSSTVTATIENADVTCLQGMTIVTVGEHDVLMVPSENIVAVEIVNPPAVPAEVAP